MRKFTLKNYPKSFASIKKDDWRLKNYLQLSNDVLKTIFRELQDFATSRAVRIKPVNKFQNLKYIGAGWEWSAFLNDQSVVYKIPAGIFPEVHTKKYFINSREAYKVVKHYFGEKFTANTAFVEEKGVRLIRQQYIPGKIYFVIPFNTNNIVLLKNLKEFLEKANKIIEEFDWLPDIEISKETNGFLLRNIVIEEETYMPKVIDFTYYFDPFRMYPQLTKEALIGMKKRLEEFTQWINSVIR